MRKIYKYPKSKILFPFLGYLVIPILPVFIVFYASLLPEKKDDWPLFLFIIGFFLSMFVLIASWILNNLNTVFEVDERGLQYKSLFKNMYVPWDQITSVKKKYLYQTSKTAADPNKDLLLKTKDNKTIKVFRILENQHEGMGKGFEDFESELKAHIKVEDFDVLSTSTKNLKKAIFAGFLIIIFGFAFWYAASMGHGISGGLPRELVEMLGIEGSAALIVIIGVIIIISAIYKIKTGAKKE
jgi:hypothetical protein